MPSTTSLTSGSPPPSGAGGRGGDFPPPSEQQQHHHHHGTHHHHSHKDKDKDTHSHTHKEKHHVRHQSKEDQRLARQYFQIQDRCLTVLRSLFAIGIPLTIINISFACVYAWIYANQYSYTKDDWQRCLIYPNQATDALGQHAEDKTNYLMAAASYAGRVFVFIIVVFKMAYVGVKDTDILPYSVFTNIMALLGIIVYREAEPIQPQPQQLSATLLTLIKYIKPDMYDFNPAQKWAPQHCSVAYSLNKWFLIFQILVVCLVCLILLLTLTCTYTNYRIGKRWKFQLEGNIYPLLLLLVAFAGYVTCFVAKETVAQLTLDVLNDSKLSSIFAFSKGELDIVSLTMMMTLGAIGVGTCKGDLEKFKLGAFVAYIHVVLSYPSVLATIHAFNSVTYPYSKDKTQARAYDIWSLDGKDGCPAYIVAKSNLFKQFPDEAHTLCRMCHVSLSGQLIQFVAQHLVVAACIYILWANRDLPAQRLRLGTYVPDYLAGVHVNVSVNAPIEGYKRKPQSHTFTRSISRWLGGGDKEKKEEKKEKNTQAHVHYTLLPGGDEGGGGVEEAKKGEKGAVAHGV